MALSPFQDDGELKWVMYLLRGWAVGELTSPLSGLKAELRRILLSPTPHEYPIGPHDIETVSDIRHLLSSGARLSNLQEACLGALQEILFATEPATWDEQRLDRMELLLTKIHGIAGDVARRAAEPFTTPRKRRPGPFKRAVQDFLVSHPNGGEYEFTNWVCENRGWSFDGRTLTGPGLKKGYKGKSLRSAFSKAKRELTVPEKC